MKISCAICNKADTLVKPKYYQGDQSELKSEYTMLGHLVCTHCGAYGHVEIEAVMKPPKPDKTDQEPE